MLYYLWTEVYALLWLPQPVNNIFKLSSLNILAKQSSVILSETNLLYSYLCTRVLQRP